MRVQPQLPDFAAKQKYTVFFFVGNQNTKKKTLLFSLSTKQAILIHLD